MITNLRVNSINVISSSKIVALFSENLSTNISKNNIQIVSQTPGVSDPDVIEIDISNNSINITSQPLTPQAAYYIIFSSSDEITFSSLNGNIILLEDDINNKILIIGPIEENNIVKEYLTNFLRYNVYDLEQPVISKYINILSTILSKALFDTKQAKNENYLSFNINDEVKIRGSGPFDRLNEEGAYEIIRVGTRPTQAPIADNIIINNFPDYPVSLLSTNNIENIILINGSGNNSSFDINSLTLTCSKLPIIILNSITFIYNSILSPFTYDIKSLGYQILDSKYDPNYAFNFLTLKNNQIKLNNKILENNNFSLEDIARIEINYQFKDLGKIIDKNTVLLSIVLPSGREVIDPLENTFFLKHAPIVSKDNKILNKNNIKFIAPDSFVQEPHAAFLYEVPFRFDYLPSKIGEFSVDYEIGRVYVFGNNNEQSGTGPFPPLANYLYQQKFISEIDYVYDEDKSDLIALPNGNLIDNKVNIDYNFEKVLIKNIDYISNPHTESLNERIDNRLLSLNTIKPLNFPITNVFRILNETSGEIYQILRWNDNKILFTYKTPPRILNITNEKASFEYIQNEILIISSSNNVDINKNIFKIYLKNNNIISFTNDSIGYNKNSSVNLSHSDIFINELYFDNNLTEINNNIRLNNIGDYQIDYKNGVIYVMVPIDQSMFVGTISYRRGYIESQNKHIISVSDIYTKLNNNSPKTNFISYIKFLDNTILPSSLNLSNETLLNDNILFPYQLYNNEVGTFNDITFNNEVSNYIKNINNIFEYQDLLNNKYPINFSTVSNFTNKTITISDLNYSKFTNVLYNGINYYVEGINNLSYLSSNITINVSIKRLSDNLELWDGSGIITVGAPVKFILSGINSPQTNDDVILTYSFTINNLSRVVVDYSKGDFLIDYDYLADEIIISYEYGENVVDFRKSDALDPGDKYYVSYRAGSLRAALLRNFGTLIDIPILNNLNVDFSRERYRDALLAALQSFTQGPTIKSISEIVKFIVHTPPEIIESTFKNWIIGGSLLNQSLIKTTGVINPSVGKFDNGILLDTNGQSLSFPITSNINLEQGTIKFWTIPNWNGLDNQSDLTFTITKNNIPISNEQVFIGPRADHPNIKNNKFTINFKDLVLGKPNESKDGVFIYLDSDSSGLFDRWFIDVIDGYDDGYSIKDFKINISNSGFFYDIKNLSSINDNVKIFSGTNNILYQINNLSEINETLTFIADYRHYFFDFADSKNKNRFSIYKDESGYLNFEVYDKNKNVYVVDADVSNWKPGDEHFISVSWALATPEKRDEMHLFIDGLEVPNIIKYSNPFSILPHTKFRTVMPEEVIGQISKNIVAAHDLITIFGSNQISSSINFTDLGIINGDTIYIEEIGFLEIGYTIINVNGNTLTLGSSMPLSGSGLLFSVNKTSFVVETEIDFYPNIEVSLLHSNLSNNDLQVVSGSNIVSSTGTNFQNNNIKSKFIIKITELGFEKHYTIIGVDNNNLTLSDNMPINFTNATYKIYSNVEEEIPGIRALLPSYSIGRDINYKNILTIKNKAKIDDIVLIRTLGINHKKINGKFYMWGDTSNRIKTNLIPPINIKDVKITHIILDTINIGPSNSTLIANTFTSNNILTNQPSVSDNGRTLSVFISGDNIDFSTAAQITINGTINGIPLSSLTLSFNSTTIQNTTDLFSQIDYIIVVCKAKDINKNCLAITIKEQFPITEAENSTIVPTIKYSYQILIGNTLFGTIGESTVSSNSDFFSFEDINNYLIIYSPPSVAGQYKIISISEDHHTITIDSNLAASFSGGNYEILNSNNLNSGLQNGLIILEEQLNPGQPYLLKQGNYEIKYNSYLSIPISTNNLDGYVGTDYTGKNIIAAKIDDFVINSNIYIDTRIGEISLSNTNNITTDFNSLKEIKKTNNTLLLLDFNKIPIENKSDIYLTSSKYYIQSGFSVNENFSKSIRLVNKPIVIENSGILNTKNNGTIEFWINPLNDTYNDPNYRFYFDAPNVVIEHIVSKNNATIVLNNKAEKILSVKLQTAGPNIDYFTGGNLENDKKTLLLNKQLPDNNTPITVSYIPYGTAGNRMSIYQDPSGFINFTVKSNIDYQIRTPIFWNAGTWHRVKAQFSFNQGIEIDEIRLFIDGYEQGNILFGNGLLFGQNQVLGSSFIGGNSIKSNIDFKDTINELYIGSDYSEIFPANALIDNLRISNISRPIFSPFGESIDIDYSPNLNIVLPITPDLYTTLLLDFDRLLVKKANLATLKNKKTGLFDITVNIFDQFNILKDNNKSKLILETLLNTLKPANSRIFVAYS